MFDRPETFTENLEKSASRKHTRIILVLVAVSCLSIGVAVGSLIHTFAGETPTDNRLSINTQPITPDALSSRFAQVAAQVEPAVVNIKVWDNNNRAFAREGTGSGFIVNAQGYIITNQHVVERAVKMKVKLMDGTEYQGKVIGQDAETDLAVIKIEPTSALPVAKIGDSERLNVGDWVLAIGSPFGFEQTVTAGIVSAKDRVADINQSAFQQFIQTDAAINPGNSGGPLVNLAGEVVGINTQIYTKTSVFSGISLAMPSSTAVDVYNQLVSNGRVRRAFLGLKPIDVTPQVARVNKLPDTKGVLVERTTDDNSPAARAGLTGGDVIVSVNNQKVRNFRELIRLIAKQPIGSVSNIAYLRGGKTLNAAVRLEERRNLKDEPEPLQQPIFDPRNPRGLVEPKPVEKAPIKLSLGLNAKILTDEMAAQRGLTGIRGAYLASVDPTSIAGMNGVIADDVLVEINYNPVRSMDEFTRLTSALKSGDDVVLKIYRRDTASPNRVSFIVSFTMP
jgi:serine protease Do